MNTIIEQNGVYPDENGIAFDKGFAVIRVGRHGKQFHGHVAVEVSTDDGATWTEWPFGPISEPLYVNHPHGHERAYGVKEHGWRFRVRVTECDGQFALWMERRD